jgi:predicted nucleotidyltransferase
MNPPTQYQDLNSVLAALVSSIQIILGSNFMGAYLHGSFALGGFDQDSDCDFMIVIQQELTIEQVEALQEMHGKIFDSGYPWPQHLEGSYITKEMLKDYRKSGISIWYLDNGHRSLVLAGHDNTLVVRCQLREYGVRLAGPDIETLIDPVPVDELRKSIYNNMAGWSKEILANPELINNRFYQAFAVFHYCRTLHDLTEGRVGSKRAGAEWAKENLDPKWRDLIDQAWDKRSNPEVSVQTPADPEELMRTLEFVSTVMEKARQIAI